MSTYLVRLIKPTCNQASRYSQVDGACTAVYDKAELKHALSSLSNWQKMKMTRK